MSNRKNGTAERVELGRHIVADPLICHGQPTFKGNGAYIRNRTELSRKVHVWNEGWSVQVESKVSPFRQQIGVGLARWKPVGTFCD